MAAGIAAAALAGGLLAGCGTGNSGLERDAARQLQARVLEVTQASSQDDPAGALRALEGLDAELTAAQDRGDISDERRRNITTIATAVRADLEEAVAAAEAAAAKAAEEKAAAEQAAAAESSAPEVAAPSAPEPGGNPGAGGAGDDNKGRDKGKGKD
jgi:hypothetical protein